MITPYSNIISVTTLALLDAYPNAAAAYSLRKLRIAYTGSAIRVRRASDSTELDIGFAANELDTSALTTFANGGNVFVKTWYDQSGNARNATQTTAANQPQIVSSGSVLLENGKPGLKFDSVNDCLTIVNSASSLKFLHSDLSTIITVNRTNSTSYSGLLGSNAGTGSRVGVVLGSFAKIEHAISNAGAFNVNNASTTLISANIQYLNFVIGDPANSTLNERSFIFINNSSVNQNNANSGSVSTANSGVPVQIGSLGGGVAPYNGNYQELIIYPSNENTNRTGIETNINDFYSIY